jgi:hypothetical protein
MQRQNGWSIPIVDIEPIRARKRHTLVAYGQPNRGRIEEPVAGAALHAGLAGSETSSRPDPTRPDPTRRRSARRHPGEERRRLTAEPAGRPFIEPFLTLFGAISEGFPRRLQTGENRHVLLSR